MQGRDGEPQGSRSIVRASVAWCVRSAPGPSGGRVTARDTNV